VKGILYTTAIDAQGALANAGDAPKDALYSCPLCFGEMLLRRSGSQGKGAKRPHFAHKSLTVNCTPESALHHSFKLLLQGVINSCLSNGEPLRFSWDCSHCNSVHLGNLLKRAKTVEVEYDLVTCRPDLALLDAEGRVVVAIEIVVTHAPEEAAQKFYKDNNIVLVRIDLKSEEDLMKIGAKVGHPDYVSICFNPSCKKCGKHLQKKLMTVIDGPCWKCGSDMKIAYISSGSGGMIRGSGQHLSPSEFEPEEISFARSKGVVLKNKYSNVTHSSYLANSCMKCGRFAGDFHLFSQYIAPACYGELPSQTFEIGYHCEECDIVEPKGGFLFGE
jgi:hypothetical protein